MAVLPLVVLFLTPAVLADLVVQLQDGKVSGTSFNVPNGQTFYAWRGIPFAQPPVGNLRFMEPVKPNPWYDVRDATNDRQGCMANGRGYPDPAAGESEDCLFVNVYAPFNINDNPNRDKVPVLFWIYGGSFEIGCGDFSSFDPSAFLADGIIVVTFNYRLSALGFLSTHDDVIPGNAALKDQLFALKWTRDNIASFGGNPDKITLAGESAGSMSVGYHVVSRLSRGLFQGAIMESGTALCDFFQGDPRYLAVTLASKIDPSINQWSSSEQIKTVLQAAPVQVIMAQVAQNGLHFGTVLEAASNGAFLSGPMFEMLEQGDFARVPVIIGHNSQETLVWYADEAAVRASGAGVDAYPQQLIPHMPLKQGADALQAANEIKALYVGANGKFADHPEKMVDFSSDDRFVRPSYRQALLQSSYVPVYFYKFSFFGTISQRHYTIQGAGKVGHGDEVPYLFNMTYGRINTDADFQVRNKFVRLWTNFVKTGNPTPGDDPTGLLNIIWPTVSTSQFTILDIDENLSLIPGDKYNDMAFWDHIFETYSYRPYNSF